MTEEQEKAESEECAELEKEKALAQDAKKKEADKKAVPKTLSEAIGTPLYPISEKMAEYVQYGVDKIDFKLKARINAVRQKKVIDTAHENSEVLKEILGEKLSEENLERTERVFRRIQTSDIDDARVREIWKNVFNSIKNGDSDIDFLIEKLENLKNSELRSLLEIKNDINSSICVGIFNTIVARTFGQYNRSRSQLIYNSLFMNEVIENTGFKKFISAYFLTFSFISLAIFFIIPSTIDQFFSVLMRDEPSLLNVGVSISYEYERFVERFYSYVLVVVGFFSVPIVSSRLYRVKLTWLGERIYQSSGLSREEANEGSE